MYKKMPTSETIGYKLFETAPQHFSTFCSDDDNDDIMIFSHNCPSLQWTKTLSKYLSTQCGRFIIKYTRVITAHPSLIKTLLFQAPKRADFFV